MRVRSAELSSRVVFSVSLCVQVWLYCAQVLLYNAERPKEMPAKIAGNNLKNSLFLVLGL